MAHAERSATEMDKYNTLSIQYNRHLRIINACALSCRAINNAAEAINK